MTKSKILIVGLNQLPHRYLYNQCKYLADHFDITVISPYEGLEKKTSSLFKTVYLDTGVSKPRFKLLKKLKTFTRIFRTIYGVRSYARDDVYDLVYIWDQTWAFAIKLLLGPKYKYVMQMFAPGVTSSRLKNKLHDLQVEFNARFFQHMFMGSERVMKFFKVPPAKAHVTGVGIEAIEYQDRVFESLDLVYLGALSNRYVHESVEGFARFFQANQGRIQMSYKIIGGGTPEAVDLVKASIAAAGPEVPVQYLGRLEDAELISVFRASNIGVVYNRITSYYTNNISTKLYEYLLSGLPVIAVKNSSMLGVVTPSNGVLIEDSPEGFEQGLHTLLANLGSFNSQTIAQSGEERSIKRMVRDRMVPAFQRIISEVK
jgi:glycosyltransferase involved in cell wall biosynthesis